MGRKKGGIDWEDVELEYLNSRISLKDLAERRQISYRCGSDQKTDEG